MQIVGSNCKTCGKGISFAADGIACRKCESVFHRKCIEQGCICPQCKLNLISATRERTREEQELDEQRHGSGRLQLQICLGLLAYLAVAPIVARFTFNNWSTSGIQGSISSLVLVALAYWTYTGQVWARIVLVLQMVVMVIVAGSQSVHFLKQGEIGHLVFSGVMLAFGLGAIGILACSPNVYFFLDSQQDEPKRSA